MDCLAHVRPLVRLPEGMWRLAHLGVRPEDGEGALLGKTTNTLMALCAMPVCAVLVVANALLGLWEMALLCGVYLVGTLSSLALFSRQKDGLAFYGRQSLLTVGIPLGAHIYSGGYLASGGVLLWAIFTPVAYLLAQHPRRAATWLAFYLAVLVGLGWLCDPWMFETGRLTIHQALTLFVLNLTGTSVLMFLILWFFVAKWSRERERAEALLVNVLPGPIAERLKRTQEVIADHFEGVTILFADLVGFTELSGRTPAPELVTILDDVFSRFDLLAERHGLEKIKTIGDAYMVVGGLPEPRDDHAVAVARLALEMRSALAAYNQETGRELSLRIGIHTGAAVAGVIGRRKFAYDLWGDSVNTASRMESHGEAGQIQVSEAVATRLGDAFRLEARGEIEVKGKGRMRTFWLRGVAAA